MNPAASASAASSTSPQNSALLASDPRSNRNHLAAMPARLAPLLLTPVVFFIHGYHPFAGDAGIYVAGIRHLLDPSLYPLNAVFPAAFTRLSIFAWILAALVRLTHVRLAWVLLAADLASIFLFLDACRRLAASLFSSQLAQGGAVLLAAGCFTLPVAGTALVVMDPYVTARSFSTPLSLLAITACVDRAWIRAALLLILAAAIHPLMGAWAILFAILYALLASGKSRLAIAFCALLLILSGLAFLLAHRLPISPAYSQAVSLAPRSFLFLARWHGYEMLGLLLPLILFAVASRRLAGPPRILCLTCLALGSTSILIAALFVPPNGPYVLVPFQVLRSFHPIYCVGLVLCGGLFASLASRSRSAAVLLIALLFAGMFVAESATWPGSSRVELPWTHAANRYQQAFLWIRDHTPPDAVFAFDPKLVYLPHEDEQGFRAIAERDHLADDKDAGIVAVLPSLAARWAIQRNAQFNVDRATDVQRIAGLGSLGATWVLLSPQANTAFPCPYRSAVVQVCRAKTVEPR